MNKKQMGRGIGFLVIVCLGLIPLAGLAADTPTSSWNGSTTAWTNTSNWAGGLPGTTTGAVFDSVFANQPNLTASASTLGLWLKTGVGQDVTVNASTPVTLTLQGGATNNGLVGSTVGSANNQGVGILMDDTANHNLTFGPNISILPPNSSTIYVNNSGTLTIQGQLINPNGVGVTLIGTSPATMINITGKLTLSGGGSINIVSNTTVLSSASTNYTSGVTLFGGAILRETHVDATKRAAVSLNNSAVLQLRSDNNGDLFCSSGTVSMAGGNTGVIDVNRLDPVGGTASNQTLCLQTGFLGGTMNVTGGNGYSLSIANLGVGGIYVSTYYVSPASANLILGGITPSYTVNGATTLVLGGTGTSNVVSGPIATPSTGGYCFLLTKSGSSTWTLGGTNTTTGPLAVNGGTLIAANNYALGFGGATRNGDYDLVTIDGATTILNLSGVKINKPVKLGGNSNQGLLINSNTNTVSTLDSGVASITFTSGGSGFVGADVGRELTISGGGGSGAAAIISALCANTNTISNVIGTGTGWNAGDLITLVGGGASQSAIYTVAASGGVITNLTVSTPGYGYTNAPTGFTRSGSGAGITPAYAQNFSVASISMTNAGSGYTAVPVVAGTAGSGSGLVANANRSALYVSGNYGTVLAQIGGDGNLVINAVISTVGNGYLSDKLIKIGAGVMTLNAANTYTNATTVSNGTISVCNTAGSGTGNGPLTIISNATLAGSGFIAPIPNTGALVALQAGSHISPHVGTGVSNATLNITVGNVTSNSLDIAAGTVFDYNFAAPGVGDTLNVTGKVNLGIGTNTLNIGQMSGFGVGTYPLITSTTTVTYRTTGWILPASTHWVYSVTNTPTSVSLKVAAAPLRATLIQIR